MITHRRSERYLNQALITKPVRLLFGSLILEIGSQGLKSMRYRIVTHIDIDPYVSDPNNNFQPLGYDEKGGSILAAGDILKFKKGETSTVVFQDLPYFVPVFLQITVQNNAGLERHNEVEIKIPSKVIKQFQQGNKKTK
ncbi:MAG: hypothetical protein U5K71_08915 [Gracilimonas sp.]|nr:hypothetical protein [Gracilimonas sp.]